MPTNGPVSSNSQRIFRVRRIASSPAKAAATTCGAVVDQPATIGALPVAVAQAAGILVGYLPGLATSFDVTQNTD